MPKKVSMLEELRPKAPKPEKAHGPTSVRFTQEEHAELVETAKRLRITISELIRWRNAHAKEGIEADLEPTERNKLRW